MSDSKIRLADENGKLLLRDSDDYTPEERKVWGITADQIIDKRPEKWDRDTTLWRLKGHCRALVMEGASREEVLQYLIDYNRLGSEVPQWFEKYLPDLVSWYEPIFKEHDREGQANKAGFSYVGGRAHGTRLHLSDSIPRRRIRGLVSSR